MVTDAWMWKTRAKDAESVERKESRVQFWGDDGGAVADLEEDSKEEEEALADSKEAMMPYHSEFEAKMPSMGESSASESESESEL